MKVKDIMIKDVVSIGPDDSFFDIVELFSEKKISGAPVTMGKKPIGMVSESDIMKFISSKGLVSLMEDKNEEMRNQASLKAKHFMTKQLIYVKPNDELTNVIKVMNEKDINRVPVVDKEKLVGIITRADVVSVVSEYLAEHPLIRKRKFESEKPSVETSIDKLVSLVKRQGSIKFSDAAKIFNVPENRIEEWGKILEEYKLVELHYPPIGTPVMKMLKVKHGKKGKA